MLDFDADELVHGYPRHRILAGGSYDPEELVQVYEINNPGVAILAFRAAYLAGQE